MNGSTIQKIILAPVFISTTLFCVFTLPVAMFGEESITIRMQDELFFHGKVRDAAAPYLGLAMLISLGVGISNATLAGWHDSSRKSATIESELDTIEQALQEKEKLIQQLQVSTSELNTEKQQKLDNMVAYEEVKFAAASVPMAKKVSGTVVMEKPITVMEPLVITEEPVLENLGRSWQQSKVKAGIYQFASAQTFLGYTKGCSRPKGGTPIRDRIQNTSSVSEQSTSIRNPQVLAKDIVLVEALQSQIQNLSAQLESLQTSLKAAPQVSDQAKVAA
ncbi:hypothetical protein BJP36_17810 [Moorena producens JHB]|uniref:Uncharacterized protein n=1 Tax=Moorena producens (strain JHB) TaxID=1454205 RepID=A0A1D9G1K1_MOOP1|nr:hypothetical protein [Moorena producens]AOY81493.2 hypothetical protein BJP36_17810 [Moorena producens JHB]